MNHAKGAPERSISRVGLTALVALVSIAAVHMYMGPSSSAATSGTGSASASPVGPEQVAGFRSDAWYLPDTELLGFVEISEGPFLMGGDVTTDPVGNFWASMKFLGAEGARGEKSRAEGAVGNFGEGKSREKV